jgi:hypothetical protein
MIYVTLIITHLIQDLKFPLKFHSKNNLYLHILITLYPISCLHCRLWLDPKTASSLTFWAPKGPPLPCPPATFLLLVLPFVLHVMVRLWQLIQQAETHLSLTLCSLCIALRASTSSILHPLNGSNFSGPYSGYFMLAFPFLIMRLLDIGGNCHKSKFFYCFPDSSHLLATGPFPLFSRFFIHY